MWPERVRVFFFLKINRSWAKILFRGEMKRQKNDERFEEEKKNFEIKTMEPCSLLVLNWVIYVKNKQESLIKKERL